MAKDNWMYEQGFCSKCNELSSISHQMYCFIIIRVALKSLGLLIVNYRLKKYIVVFKSVRIPRRGMRNLSRGTWQSTILTDPYTSYLPKLGIRGYNKNYKFSKWYSVWRRLKTPNLKHCYFIEKNVNKCANDLKMSDSGLTKTSLFRNYKPSWGNGDFFKKSVWKSVQ